MADHQKVLQEMQIKFPTLPADLVKSCFAKYAFDREKCMLYLAQVEKSYTNPKGATSYGHDINRNNAVAGASPITGRRISYPMFHNGNHEAIRNDSLRTAPASEMPFQFTRQQHPQPYRPANQQPPDPHFPMPRIPSPIPGGSQLSPYHMQSSHSTSPGSPRLPSPIGKPQQDTLVTYKEPLHLAMPENNYNFEENFRDPNQIERHISTLEISPGATPFQSSQFWCYTKPSNPQEGGKHTTSFNVQIPSPSKPSLTTQIFVETSVAPSPEHYTPVTSSPRYHEPVLIVPSLSTRPEKTKEKLQMGGVGQAEHDERAYVEALLAHQRQGFEMLSQELAQKKIQLQQMKLGLQTQEQELFERRTNSSNRIFSAEETGKLCDEIRKLRVDCHCMSMEVDLLNSNQVPLGVTDENFYQNIFPGQDGRVGRALATAVPTAVAVPTPPTPSQSHTPDLLRNGSPTDSRPQDDVEGKRWKCPQCTFFNHPDLSVCEICEIPRATPPACGNGPARL